MKILKSIIIVLSIFLFNACKEDSKQTIIEIENKVVQHDEDVVFGDDDATNTMFLYASYNCQYCRYLFSRTVPDLKENYLDKGLLKIVVKWVEFGDDPHVLRSLKAASCIYQFGQYEKMHELLLTNPNIVETNDFNLLIDDIMAKNSEIAECVLASVEYDFIKFNVNEFRTLGFKGTPTLIMNNHAYAGFVSYEKIKDILKREFGI